MSASQPLLPRAHRDDDETSLAPRAKRLTTLFVPVVLVCATIGVLLFGHKEPRGPLEQAKYWLETTPVIDGHIDLPILVRELYGNDITKFDLNKPMQGHVDIPRIREGHLGGFFWSVYTDCHEDEDGPDFLNPSHHVRDTLEQIDVARNIMAAYPDTFQYVTTADEAHNAVRAGKVASFMGIEGAHQLGNSLGVLRQYYNLGVRYATLTHSCNNAFADSGGFINPPPPKWHGLSPLGKELIKEMNRLGMLIDISHVSEQTAEQAIDMSQAPVMFSHSDARHYNNISRNVPDYILDKIGNTRGKNNGVVMVNFFPFFASPTPDKVGIKQIADQIEYIAQKTSKDNVGIGSDYDGIDSVPHGLEDVSKYPYLFAELITRGWTKYDIGALAGGNILRVLADAEKVAQKLQRRVGPNMAHYSKRTDLGRGGVEL